MLTPEEFAPIAIKLKNTGLIPVMRPNKRGQDQVGLVYIGATNDQNIKLWKTYQTLFNIPIFKKSDKANEILRKYGITQFIAKPTKTKTVCRLHLKQ